jgi:hypothetical protein
VDWSAIAQPYVKFAHRQIAPIAMSPILIDDRALGLLTLGGSGLIRFSYFLAELLANLLWKLKVTILIRIEINNINDRIQVDATVNMRKEILSSLTIFVLNFRPIH